MLNRIALLRFLLNILDAVFIPVRAFFVKTDRGIKRVMDRINQQEFVFFTKGDNIASLNEVRLYISKNEQTKKIKIFNGPGAGEKVPTNLPHDIDFLDREYPEIDIEFIVVEGVFSPELIKELSEKWNIPINFMFIGSPSDKFPYKIEELGGVRLII